MARMLWAGALGLAMVVVPLNLSAKLAATPQATLAPTVAATPGSGAAATPAPTPAASKSPTPAAASGTAQAVSKPVTGTSQAKGVSASAKAGVNHKSGALATVIAFVPGVAVHGAGHMYAGSWMKGLGLFLLSGACVYEDLQVYQRNNFARLTTSNGIPTDLSGAETDSGIALVCTMGFLWTWFSDIGGASVAVDEYNKIQDQQSVGTHAQLQLLPTQGGAMLALNTRF